MALRPEANGAAGYRRLLTTDAAAGYVILRELPGAEGLHDGPLRHVPDGADPSDYFRLGPGRPGWERGCSTAKDVQTIVLVPTGVVGPPLLDGSPQWQRGVTKGGGNAVWGPLG